MRAYHLSWSPAEGWKGESSEYGMTDLVIYFGTREALACSERYKELHNRFPEAHILGCSTGGQIQDDDVTDESIGAIALGFEATELRATCQPIEGPIESYDCGAKLGRGLAAEDLAGIFILSDGLKVNGSALVDGISSVVGHGVPLTGGLAGDGDAFQQTLVGCNAPPQPGCVAAVGFYGNAVRIGHGSAGGWNVFGPRRVITRSEGNILYELDGTPALDLYEHYLGEEAKGLPGTGLLFPLRISDPDRPNHDVVRTILGVDREARTMTFAGDMPLGWCAQLMRGNIDRLAAGAAEAARNAREGFTGSNGYTGAAILVSCIGRRLLMGQRIIEEVEAAASELGDSIPRLGFYSYGEISPHAESGASELHNQTMTATVIGEAAGV